MNNKTEPTAVEWVLQGDAYVVSRADTRGKVVSYCSIRRVASLETVTAITPIYE
ncbi:MAG: hypothetical protein JKX83_09100 [Pseudomonadales bacterium]|nr:hypothetical protein [Pseudomonadales bacterium]